MKIFPIGTISAASSSGTMDSVSYTMFEPNLKCNSQKSFNILTTRFEDQTLLARKKSEPRIAITYEYSDIFDREFRQIEHFTEDVEDALNSFHVVDFNRGLTPSSVTDSSGDWVVAIGNTKDYSTTTNKKANRAFLWDGLTWKEGDVVTVTTNTSIKVNVDGSNYGSLVVARANTDAMVYPLYECYFNPNVLQNFKPTKFFQGDTSLTADGGFMKSGSIIFTSKYKV